MPAYLLLPAHVHALRFTGCNTDAIAAWCGPAWRRLVIPDGPDLEVSTFMGTVRAQPGDWLIRGWHGGFEVQGDAQFIDTHQAEEVMPND